MMQVELALQQKLRSGGMFFAHVVQILSIFPNDKKCLIISKKAREESVREAFKETSIKCNSPRAETLGGAFLLPAFLDTGLPTGE